MNLVFDPSLDGPAWPGPLGDREAAFGEAWVGPLGLLSMLETQLGLGGTFPTPLQRACRLVRSLQSMDGFWRPSFDRDPIGTSRRLLADRDTLTMWGWKGQPVSKRLAELWRVTTEAADGPPDRLARVATALGKRKVDVRSLALFSPVRTLEPLWRDVFAALAAAGADLAESEVPEVTARGDLAGARAVGFQPQGDGTLCLLRRYGALDAADEVAATLAAMDDLHGVVVIGGDAILDRALARHGLPRPGGDAETTASSRILPLVVEAAFEPMDPGDLHGLLTLDPGPVPRSIAAPLVRALRDEPGRRSSAWTAALAQALENIDEDGRERMRERLATLLMPSAQRTASLATDALHTRLAVLRAWANARSRSEPSLALVGQQIETLLDAIDEMGAAALTRAELRRLCSALDEGSWAPHAAEAGLAPVGQPGALLGPARTIVWWSFMRGRAPRPGQMFLTRAEEAALAAAGVQAPDFALLMEAEARRWRRPLSLATERLVLVCPQTTESGEPEQPHPLWDELTASLARPDDIHLLVVSGLDKVQHARSIPATLRPLVQPSATATARAPVPPREVESPSSVEKLIGCSFSWALHYPGRLRPGLADGPATLDSRLQGSMAHDLLAQVLGALPETPEAAAARAAERFDAQAHRICEAIDLPAHQVDRATLRRTVVDAARELTRLLREAGAQVVGTEVTRSTTVFGHPIEGRLDLVLSGPDFVIDLKWGKTKYVEALKNGVAIQLAAYAAMHQESCGRADIGIGYFLLRSRELVTSPQARLGGGYAPGQHQAPAIWAAALTQTQIRRDELARGVLCAPGSDGSEATSTFDGTRLHLAPGCTYCDLAGLCGRKGAQ